MESIWAPGRLRSRWIFVVLIVALAVYAAASFAIATVNTMERTGGTDLYTYWRINHFTRVGEDPYKAYLDRAEVELPVRYVDGPVATTRPIAETDEEQKLPGNSPPMLFLLLPLSYLSWPVAKVVWMIMSVALVLVTPWLALRLLPIKLSPVIWVMMSFGYYGLPGTRAAIVTGQTALIVIALVFLTFHLVLGKRNLLAGLALGIALSKVSVAMPLFIYLLYKRNWVALAVGVGVQTAGFIAMAFVRGGSPVQVFVDFASIAGAHARLTGIHLTGLFHPGTPVSIVVGVIFSLAVLLPLWRYAAKVEDKGPKSELRDFMVFAVLGLWGLLGVYHRAYDIGMALPAIVLLLYGVSSRCAWNAWGLTQRQSIVLFLTGVFFISLPVRFVEDAIGVWWESFAVGSITVVLLVLLAASLSQVRQLGRTGPRAPLRR
ncbi:MAG: glycosyltransferase family 87 protein [Chloroflexi bacterium]|nr:glycosyltransferase family 87 protein [Chloroflexota bacterium]